MIIIVDYGSGNIAAIANCLQKLRVRYQISGDHKLISQASSIVLAGVGAFDQTMKLIHKKGLYGVLNEQVFEKQKNILGICVGMQIMAENSEEGDMDGFGWIPGSVRRMKIDPMAKPSLPHMGWNSIRPSDTHPLFYGLDPEKGFYFLHSYYFDATFAEHVLATASYGSDFPCVVRKENVYGAQFHPEKSHFNGSQLIKNFTDLPSC